MRINHVRMAQVPRLIHTARCQVVLTLPSGVTTPDQLADVIAAENKAATGVSVKIYLPSPRNGSGSLVQEHRARLAKSGAELRTTVQRLPRLANIDGTVLVVARNGRDYAEGGLVGYDLPFTPMLLCSLEAEPAAGASSRSSWTGQDMPEPLTKAVVRQLARGTKDEAAAREMGLALRTYQRVVANIMNQLDARSRFQAGFLSAQRQR